MGGSKILQLVFLLRLPKVEYLEPFMLLIWNAVTLKNRLPSLLPLYFREDLVEMLFLLHGSPFLQSEGTIWEEQKCT